MTLGQLKKLLAEPTDPSLDFYEVMRLENDGILLSDGSVLKAKKQYKAKTQYNELKLCERYFEKPLEETR